MASSETRGCGRTHAAIFQLKNVHLGEIEGVAAENSRCLRSAWATQTALAPSLAVHAGVSSTEGLPEKDDQCLPSTVF
jgi:hypothetical protein